MLGCGLGRGEFLNRENGVVALACDVSEQAKWDAYEARVAKLPKRDRRELSRASAQTKWIMNATAEWYGFYYVLLSSFGLPRENWITRLWEPRSKHMNCVPRLPEPSALAAAVEAALPHIRGSRRRVLLVVEWNAERGLAYSAHKLGMSVNATSKYLEEARQSLADILRAGGWKVPQKD